jgi:uncharacterized membrane protein
MEQAHLHLLLNHLPILGTFFGLLCLVAGLILKSSIIKKLALITLFVTALLTFPTSGSGEPAEEAIEHLPGVDHDLIHEHEELAEQATLLMAILGLVSAATFYMVHRQNKFAGPATIICFVLALLVFGLMANVGWTGGKIRHPEIRSVSTT